MAYYGRMPTRSLLTAVCTVGIALVLAGCSNGSSSPTTSGTAAPTTSSAAPSPSPTGSPDGPLWVVNNCQTGEAVPAASPDLPPLSGVEGLAVSSGGGAPKVAVSLTSTPAEELITVDLVEGEGDPVPATGAAVTVEYCGVGQETRTFFDSSWSRGEPATFPLSSVIAGWTEGIPGMKPGGRRVLVIPGDLAYGPDGRPPVILPNETLIFVVELLEWSS